MTSIELSVIVPAKDAAEFLPTALKSLQQQTVDMSQVEILFINDGSTDHTPAVLEEYGAAFPHFTVFTNQHAVGLANARNIGLNNAQGTYIMFFDGDDWFMPGALDSHLAAIKELDVDFIRSDHVQITGKSRVIRRVPMAIRNRAFSPRRGILPPYDSTMIDYPYAWAGIFHRRLLEAGLLHFPENFMTAEDRSWIWNLHLKAESCAVIDTPGVCYRRGLPDSLSQVIDARQLYFIPAFALIFSQLDGDLEAERFYPKAVRNWLAILEHQAKRFSMAPLLLRQRFSKEAKKVSSGIPREVLLTELHRATSDRRAAVLPMMPDLISTVERLIR